MTQLHETLMGRKLIEGTLPEIARQLKRIADALEKQTEEEEVVTTEMDDLKTLILYEKNTYTT
jgi:hypothetical protein